MYSRSAYMLGTVAEADRVSFNRALETDVLPIIRSMPGVTDAQFHFTEQRDPQAPEIYALLTIYYPSRTDMERALASPQRGEMQQKFKALLPAFQGTITHVNSTVV